MTNNEPDKMVDTGTGQVFPVVPVESQRPSLQIAEIAEIHAEIEKFVARNLIVNQDYGIISGVKHPSLFKPGAEKLCKWWEFTQSEQLSSTRVEIIVWGKKQILSVTSRTVLVDKWGRIRAVCDSNCNSAESKYDRSTQWLTKNKLPAGTDWKKLPTKQMHKKNSQETFPVYGLKVEPNPYSMLQTIMMMAQKRSYVGATRIATGVSGTFTQDVESFDKNQLMDEAQEKQDKPSRQQNQGSGSAESGDQRGERKQKPKNMKAAKAQTDAIEKIMNALKKSKKWTAEKFDAELAGFKEDRDTMTAAVASSLISRLNEELK